MTRIPAGPDAESWRGPVLIRGWLRVRDPWLHPIAAMKLIKKWSRLKKDVDRGPGFLSFEYWQRLESFVFGMHVGWRSNAELLAFYRTPSHHDISVFAMATPLVRAMKLETLALGHEGRVIRLGGFYICSDDSDLPSDSFFPEEHGSSGAESAILT